MLTRLGNQWKWQLMVWVGKALDQQETALGVFLDIDGAFNNSCYDTMCDTLLRHGGDYTIVWWIRANLNGCVFVATLDGSCVRVVVSRGYLQWGVLSPLLWCLVVDDWIAVYLICILIVVAWQSGR
jgi:hypothetical protein